MTNMTSLLSYTNTVTEGFWGTTILIVIFFVSFLVQKAGYPSHKAFASSAIMVAIASVFFRVLGLVNNLVLIVSIILAGVGLFWMWMEEAN